MLARVTGGQSGIIEYLKDGMKADRELSRDELDHRVNIDGNINITDELIKEMNQEGRKEAYLHITLSFGERDLNEETIIEAYKDYKDSIMSAYSSDEFNVYAEIHYPKVKSYKDKKTGEQIERFPHVHMIVPQKNLVSDKALKPFGLYSTNIKYHDAIQETVNRKHGLESPYENQRKYRMTDNSEFISRYKGDAFKGSNAKFKNEIFEQINTKNISSMEDFKKELAGYGEVTTGKKGSVDEYLQIKLTGSKKNIRLKENAFKGQYIEKRELEREKPSDKKISTDLNEWRETRSHEMKHIHTASPKVRKEYNELTKEKQKEFLYERRNDFTRRYDTRAEGEDNIRPSGRQANREPSPKRNGGQRFTQITNGLPGMPKRSLDAANRRENSTTEGVLPNHEHNHLELRRADRDNELRWSNDRSGRRGRGIKKDKLESFPDQLLQQHKAKNSPQVLKQFKEIRKNLEAERVLDYFQNTHGLIKSNYKTFKAKDGSARIKIGNRAYNISDFSTQHMRQDWSESKEVLAKLYKKQLKTEYKTIDESVIGLNDFKQLKGGLPKTNLFKQKPKTIESKKEEYVLNSIVSMSGFITKGNKKQTKASILNDSVRTLKYLQQQERYGEQKMEASKFNFKFKKDESVDDKNTISSSTNISLAETTDNFKKQQKIAKQFAMKMSDLVAAKDLKNNKVEFNDKNTGKPVFQDVGSHVVMSEKQPKIEHVAVAMTFAAEKFGKVAINGTKEFKQQAIEVAVAKNLSVVFADKKMQEQFIKDKEVLKNSQVEQTPENTTTKDNPSIQNAKENKLQDSSEHKPPLILVSHGAAPYLNVKENSRSYYVETSDGKTQWGVALKDALEKINVKIGDEIAIKPLGKTKVEVEVDIKDSKGEVTGFDKKTVHRNEFEIIKVKDNNEDVEVEVLSQREKEANKNNQLNINYEHSRDPNGIDIRINGKSPKEASDNVLAVIKNNDKFLKNYSNSDIRNGRVNPNISRSMPLDKVLFEFNQNGEPVKVKDITQDNKSIEETKNYLEAKTIDDKNKPKNLDEVVFGTGINKTDSEALKDKNAKEVVKNFEENNKTKAQEKPDKDENKNLKVTYDWSEKDKKMEVKINGKSPKEIPDKVLDTIKTNDKFLKSYSTSDIKGGKLDLTLAKATPAPKTFDNAGYPVDSLQDTHEPKQTQ